MKKVIFLLIAMVFFQALIAQDKIEIGKGTTLSTSDDAWLILDDLDLNNEGIIQSAAASGKFQFTGSRNIFITGKGQFSFDRFLLDKINGSTVSLESDLEIMNTLEFIHGNLNLGNHNIHLGSKGMLVNERENSHAFTRGVGYLEAQVFLDHRSQMNPGNLGLYLHSNQAGNAMIRRGHIPQVDVNNGESSIMRYYDIISMNNQPIDAAIVFNYFESELNKVNESKLVLLKSGNRRNWSPAGFDQRNALGNYIEKKSVENLNRITLSTVGAHLGEIDGFTTSPIQDMTNGKENCIAWPNPVFSQTTISVYSLKQARSLLFLFDAKGALVKKTEIQLVPGSNQILLEMKELPKGNYVLHVKWEGTMKSIKLDKM